MEDLELDQVDFKSAYLNGEIEEEIYIEFPDGYKQGDKVGRLNKAIYGTRQGGNPGFPPHGIHQIQDQFNSNPSPGHWKAVQHVLKYLKGTADLGLTYGPSNPDSQYMLQAYCDANYAGDEDRR